MLKEKQKMRKLILAVFMILVFTTICFSQEASQIKVGTGGPTGTYSRMFKEMVGICNQNVYIEVGSSGSMENIERLLANEINAAMVQTDVMFLKARTEDMGAIKTLVALHPEEVHFIAKGDTGLKSGGYFGTSIGGKAVVFNTISDLEGYTVGAVGGSSITAQIIRLQSEISFKLVEFPKNEEMLAALQNNQIQCAIMVGGSPMSAVKDLGREYKLLSVSEQIVKKLADMGYKPAKLTYSKMGPGGTGVPTIATDALLVMREYKSPRYAVPLMQLRECLYKNLVDLQETTGKHPKWIDVKEDNKGKWAYMVFPPNLKK
jgi:TRAP-type uncharacterized transport system substrate-binding protein